MNETSAKAISLVFHPLLYPFYILLWLLNSGNAYSYLLPFRYKVMLLAMTLALTFFIPGVIIFLMMRIRMISSIFMITREERMFPLITTGIFFYMTYYFFKDLYLPGQYPVFILGSALLILIALLVNLVSKISLHMIAAGTVAGFFLFMFPGTGILAPVWFLIAVLVSGLTGTARLKLNAHRPREIFTGWLLGFAGMGLYSLLC
jgi:hypothetical protein